VSSAVSILQELGTRSGGDVTEELEASRQLAAQITRQAMHVEEALVRASAATKAALSALLGAPGGPDAEELPDGAEVGNTAAFLATGAPWEAGRAHPPGSARDFQALLKEASSKLQEAEAVAELRLGNCASLIRERHAADMGGQQGLPEAARLACSEQVGAKGRGLSYALCSCADPKP